MLSSIDPRETVLKSTHTNYKASDEPENLTNCGFSDLSKFPNKNPQKGIYKYRVNQHGIYFLPFQRLTLISVKKKEKKNVFLLK